MNLIRLGPGVTFDRPLTLDKIGEGSIIVSVAPLEDIIPPTGITGELGAVAVDPVATTACWRQAAFHSEQIGRLNGPQGSDATRNMTSEMAEIHRGQLALHLADLGVVEAAQR